MPMREYLRRYHALATERDQLTEAMRWATERGLDHAVRALRPRLDRVEAEMAEIEAVEVMRAPVYDRT